MPIWSNLWSLEIGTSAKSRPAALEHSPAPEGVVGEPCRVADIEDEPSVGDRDEAGLSALEARFQGSAQLGGGVLDRRHVVPEILEPVVRARLGREDVEDDVEVVGDDPVALALALDGVGEDALVAVLEAVAHLVDDRLRLARVLARADDEEVGVRAHRPHVEDDDVLRQLLLGEAGDSACLFQ